MQEIPPPSLPWHTTDIPVSPDVMVRYCVVPASAPPFDDERNAEGNGLVRAAAADQPGESQDATGQRPSDQDQPGEEQPGEEHPAAATAWPSQFAQVLAEALAGSRPARQLTPWTTEQARRRIRQLGPLLATSQRPKVARIMTSAPAQNVLEMTAVVRFGPRLRVLALRLERAPPRAGDQGGSRWCCTAIESA
jgi:hypothetical protein